MTECPYAYEPTLHGMRYKSDVWHDPLRDIPCVLYPDNRRERLFDPQAMEKIARFPFRPVALAKLAPCYELELHCVSGMAGYGRFAVVKGHSVVWLDEFTHVETEYDRGEMRYVVQDDRISALPIAIAFVAGRGACGLLIRVDSRQLEDGIAIYYLHGGVLGWHTHSPYQLPYNRNACWGNHVTIHDGYAQIRLEEQDTEPYPYGLERMTMSENRMSVNRLWRVLDGWKQQVLVRAEGATLFAALPDALTRFLPDHLRTVREARGDAVCAKLPVGGIAYAAVGLGDAVREGDLSALYRDVLADNHRIAECLTVRTGLTEFDGAVTIGAFPAEGVFGDNVFLHGNLSWREGYQGWRVAYGPLAYGMTESAAKHFENHFSTTLITEGPDEGAFCATTEEANPKAIAFYNMHQTFLHQARRYWEYTGDKAFAKRLLPIVEGSIARDIRRLKPGEEMLFENCLNTWISDHHWAIMGQCTQASAYLYNIHLLAAELSEDADKKSYYREQAEAIKRDMNRVLWQTRKGVYAYSKDLRGHKLLHTEPELADIYHPTELGVADDLRTYQMLDWAEANLQWETTDNGARLCRSSNWHPNGGDLYSHSIYELNGGEEFNLALAYQKIGLADPAYGIFKFIYQSLYGGRDPEVYDYNADVYRLRGGPTIRKKVALDLACHLSVNGTSRLNCLFGDSIGMFGREVYEGILGVHPMLQRGEVWLEPCLPTEMPHVDMHSAVMDYVYDRTDRTIRVQYRMKPTDCTLCVKLQLPVSRVLRVAVNGADVPYTIEPTFCGIRVLLTVANASAGDVEVTFEAAHTRPAEERRVLISGERLVLDYPDEVITELMDPQGLLEGAEIEGSRLVAQVATSEGSGVFFLKMRVGEAAYIRPVKVRIGQGKQLNVFRGFREEFTAPYDWKLIEMDSLWNHATPLEAMSGVMSGAVRPPEAYSQINFDYYSWHVHYGFNTDSPIYGHELARWRSLVDDRGVAVTGEGIPFRSSREGNCMAAATLVSPAYADRVVVPVGDSGRAVYLLVSGITFPMQSHVENLRIVIRYEDGGEETHPLVNPDGIGDMWFTKFGRYHDTPANGFENIGGGRGALSSAGQDLTKAVPTDLAAHILRFRLREGVAVREIEMRVIANDVIFALMGVTVLK